MYRPTERQILLPDDFFLPFGGKLKSGEPLGQTRPDDSLVEG